MSGPPLSILLVGDYPDDPRLGSSKVFYKLREEFTALGHVCDVLWSGDIGPRPASRQIRQLVSPWMAARSILKQADGRRYDVIDAASAEGLGLGVVGLIPDRDRAAYVCRSNGLEHLNYARMVGDHVEGLRRKSWLRRVWYPASRLSQVAAAARLADAVVVLNEVDRTFVLDRGWQPADAVTVVAHGISARFLADAPPRDARRGAGLLFCGTWDYVKGTTYLCEAFRQVHAAGHMTRLTVLGPGVPSSAVLTSFDARVRPFVTVIERTNEDRVMEEYRRHDALLWTSTYEGFGLVLLEAMTQRLPVIATPAGCAATLVRDGETGYAVPPRDAAALARAIVTLLANPDEARSQADRACHAVSAMSWRATAEHTLDVYRRAIAKVRGRA